MKLAKCLFIFGGLIVCNPAFADCAAEQREANRLHSEATRHATTCGYAIYYRAEAAFIRHCAAELGLLPLQAEQKAHEDDVAAQVNGSVCGRPGDLTPFLR